MEEIKIVILIYKKNQQTDIHGYNAKEIETKWSKQWLETDKCGFIQKPINSIHSPSSDKPNYYVLSMFPYPSGKLHMGHVRVYTISDVIARVQRMRGHTVLNPIGWDSFGLPAENAARQNNCSASEWTEQNISDMTEQLKPLGINFQWDRELQTSSKEYYKWTQWIFLQLFKNGLAYQKNSYVNWDPIDKTVLANEQILVDGTSWRSGAKVEKRPMNQWFFKISDYAERLLNGLDLLKNTWPSTVLTLQKNWIGKPSKGITIQFNLEHHDDCKIKLPLDIFTTRPDTIFGTSFVGISPHHQILHDIQLQFKDKNLKWSDDLSKLLNDSLIDRFSADECDITIPMDGFYVKHPLTGKELPVYICSYILHDYGTGAVMGVPAHDERDEIVAKKYSLPIKNVLQNIELEDGNSKTILIDSEDFTGKEIHEATTQIFEKLNQMGISNKYTMYRIRDWLVSRQRYWGAPIPIIHW